MRWRRRGGLFASTSSWFQYYEMIVIALWASSDRLPGSFAGRLHRIIGGLLVSLRFLLTRLSRMNQTVSWSASFSTETFSFSADIPKQCSDRIDRRILAQVWKNPSCSFARCRRNVHTQVGKNLFPSISVSDVQAWKLDTPIRYLDWHGGSMFFWRWKIPNGAKARTNETGFQFCLPPSLWS